VEVLLLDLLIQKLREMQQLCPRRIIPPKVREEQFTVVHIATHYLMISQTFLTFPYHHQARFDTRRKSYRFGLLKD